MKQRFLARMRAALDEIEQNAPADLALFEYVDLLTAQVAELAAPRDLRSAAEAGDLHTTRALLRKPGVDVDAENENGTTAMYIAAAHGHTVVVEVLADEGQADVSKSTPADAKLLLVESWRRSNPPPESWKPRDHGCIPPLYIAVRNGRLDTVWVLLQRGADVGQATGREATALLGASRDGRTAVITVLLDHGANADQANIDGDTPVCYAAHGGHVEAIKLLLDHGADVDKANNNDKTPVWTASKEGHAEAVEILLAAGATTDVCDHEGRTPFHAAAIKGNCEVITVLLDHGGVDINQVVGEYHEYPGSTGVITLLDHTAGSTALQIASENGRVGVIKLLLKRGVDVNQVDEGGWTPVSSASVEGHADAVHVLLKGRRGCLCSQSIWLHRPPRCGTLLRYRRHPGAGRDLAHQPARVANVHHGRRRRERAAGLPRAAREPHYAQPPAAAVQQAGHGEGDIQVPI